MNNDSSKLNSNPAVTEQSAGREASSEFWMDYAAASEQAPTKEVDINPVAEMAEREQCAQKIAALGMRGKPTPRPRNSWLNTVGKYPEGSPIDEIFEEGSRIRAIMALRI